MALAHGFGSESSASFVKIADALCFTEHADVDLAPSLHRVLGSAGHNQRPECLLRRGRVHRLTRQLQIKGDVFKKGGAIVSAGFDPVGICLLYTSDAADE